jgi:carbamate kinase
LANFVYIIYCQPDQNFLTQVKVSELEKYYQAGMFDKGSMGSNVEVATDFILKSGKKAIIANLFDLMPALQGKMASFLWVSNEEWLFSFGRITGN